MTTPMAVCTWRSNNEDASDLSSIALFDHLIVVSRRCHLRARICYSLGIAIHLAISLKYSDQINTDIHNIIRAVFFFIDFAIDQHADRFCFCIL